MNSALDFHKEKTPAGVPGGVQLAIVTVTFHPDLQKLQSQMAALPDDGLLFIVDNASGKSEVELIKRLVDARPNTALIENSENLGLAAAANKGSVCASEQIGLRGFLLLLDQDSQPQDGAIAKLISAFLELEANGRRVGCVGPQLVDITTGLRHGFHAIRGLRWVRIFPESATATAVICTNLNGSGTLMRMSLYRALGGLDEMLFIDHVDTDWAFRVLAAGFELLGIPDAVFNHSMGERGVRFWWFGWHVWPQRSPQRHYYLFRNARYLLRQSYVPGVWKFWAVVKLALTMVVYAAFDARRVQHLREMFSGLRDAGRLRLGR
jgi:rhamnosyltransferase